MNSHEFAAKVAEDKAASFTLQRMIATAAERDVLDALIDAEALAAFCKLRAKEAGIKFNTQMAETAGRECVLLQGISADLLAALQSAEDALHVLFSFYAPAGEQITGRVSGTEGLPYAEKEVEIAWLDAINAESQARAAIAKATT